MDAVAPVRPPIATIRSPASTCFEAIPRGQDADRPAEDQRIGQVRRVDSEGAVDGRDAHAVAVVAYARDHPLEHTLRVQDPGGDRARIEVRRGDAEDVGVADWPGAQAGPERIADDAAEPRVRTAVGVDR